MRSHSPSTRAAASRLFALALAVGLAAVLPSACGGGSEGDAAVATDEPTLPRDPGGLEDELERRIDEHVARVRAAPSDARAHGTLGLVYEANNLWSEARECFAKARALGPSEPLWALHEGIAAERLGDLEGALEVVRAAAGRHPGFAPLQGRLGDLLSQRGEVLGAREAYEAAARLEPRAPEPLVGLGEIALSDGEPEKALDLLERAVALDSGYRSAHYVLGLAYRALGRDEEAERSLARGARGTKRSMRDAATLQLAGLAVGGSRPLVRSQQLLKRGRFEEAVAVLEPAVERYPDNPRLLLNLALAYFRLERHEQAIGAILEAERLDPTFHMIPFNQAGFLMQLGRPEEALERTGRTLELAPEFAPAWFVRGRALLALERLDEAGEALLEADRRAPKDPEVQRALGDLARAREQPDKAREHYRAACVLAPDDWRAFGDLVRLELEQGDLDAAALALEQAQRLAPDDPGVLGLARELDQARSG